MVDWVSVSVSTSSDVDDAVERALAASPEFTGHADALRVKLAELGTKLRIESLRVEDLLVAVACAAGDASAIARFERECISAIDKIIGHMRLPAPTVDDIKQAIRAKLLVRSEDETPPKISEYRGRGPLRNWVGVIATREAMGLLRAKKPIRDSDDALMGIESPNAGPELGYLKEHYRAAFAGAFAEALTELSPESRNALRMHYIHGLGVDRLAALYGMHRSNAARRVARARDQVLAATRRRLLVSLNVDRKEIDSVMRLVESRIDVSVQRLLESAG